MSRVPVLTLENAPEAARPFLQTALNNSGYIPNLLGVLANAPAALETYLTVSGLNAKASLGLPEREVVQLVAATTHGCDFCVAGHTAVARNKARLPEPVIEALRARGFSNVYSLRGASRGAVTDEQFEAFRAAGFDQAQALEVILGVSLATLCNFANVFARTPLNAELEQYRWTNPQA